LYQNHASGIALFMLDGGAPSINADIAFNTIINASDARWCILIVDGATGAKVYNNIIINQHPWKGSIALDPDAVPGFNSDYNILVNSLSNQGDGVHITLAQWQALGYDAHSMLAAPLNSIFVNPAGSDYHLLTNSQAVNAGSSAFLFGITTDLRAIRVHKGRNRIWVHMNLQDLCLWMKAKLVIIFLMILDGHYDYFICHHLGQ
jgi:hypothetical protein